MASPRRLLVDDNAASSAEYALTLGLVGAAVAIASITLGNSVACAIEKTAARIDGSKVPGHPGQSDPNGEANGHLRC